MSDTVSTLLTRFWDFRNWFIARADLRSSNSRSRSYTQTHTIIMCRENKGLGRTLNISCVFNVHWWRHKNRSVSCGCICQHTHVLALSSHAQQTRHKVCHHWNQYLGHERAWTHTWEQLKAGHTVPGYSLGYSLLLKWQSLYLPVQFKCKWILFVCRAEAITLKTALA